MNSLIIEKNPLFFREALVKARKDAYTSFGPYLQDVLSDPGSAEYAAFIGSLGLLTAKSKFLYIKATRDKLEDQGQPISIELGQVMMLYRD